MEAVAAWAIDTGTSRNASAWARVELVGKEWRAWVWKWQGAPGSPLSIEHEVGPGARALFDKIGPAPIAADGWYLPEFKRGFDPAGLLHIKQQGGELKDVYSPTRRLVKDDARPYTLAVQAIGWVWTGSDWQEDPRSGERAIAGIKAVESEHRGGKLVVSLPEQGDSHHDEAVAVMRALWRAEADKGGPQPVGGSEDTARLFWSHRAVQPPPRREEKPRTADTFLHARARR